MFDAVVSGNVDGGTFGKTVKRRTEGRMLQAVQALRVRAGGSGAAPVWRLLSSAAAKPKKTTTPKISAAPAPPHKTITIHSLATKKRKGVPISMVTAYDYPSAVHVDKAGIDILLVGDSVGMVELGHDTTLPVTLDDMIHHCKAVGRGCRRPLLVGDMPFGSYETSPQKAAESAIRIMKEAGMDAVKLEGGRSRLGAIRAVLDCGIAVMGHIGLMPQSFSGLGGFKCVLYFLLLSLTDRHVMAHGSRLTNYNRTSEPKGAPPSRLWRSSRTPGLSRRQGASQWCSSACRRSLLARWLRPSACLSLA